MSVDVLQLAELGRDRIAELAARYGVCLVDVADAMPIPGSYWGAPEAGLKGAELYARADTPVHSLLHELAHYVCMNEARRRALDTDAGGSDDEECAVCYLQLVLADRLGGFGLARCLRDMDAWGYSFREGSAAGWFAGDGQAAHAWLLQRGLIDARGGPTWALRGTAAAA
jgi:hypothetical protein